MGLELDEVVIVGDNLATDIACGKAAGIATVLTLTGVTSQAQLANCSDEVLPDLVIQNLCEQSFIELFV
jgi:ribonucleotide monophosphatase NagD (HAD superfamily)